MFVNKIRKEGAKYSFWNSFKSIAGKGKLNPRTTCKTFTNFKTIHLKMGTRGKLSKYLISCSSNKDIGLYSR